jgi:hypothetical protein
MKKLLLVAFSLLLLGLPNAQARNSAATYDNKFYSQQEFVQGYNNSTSTIYRDFVVGLDKSLINTSTSINPNINLGQYVTEVTGSTTDSIFVFGVADETIPAGQLGRICIRGPHKVVTTPGNGATNPYAPAIGTAMSQCNFNVANFNASGVAANAINGGFACPYTTATGTAGGMLGYSINATATTDTGDVGQSTNSQNFTTGSEYWIWVEPHTIR